MDEQTPETDEQATNDENPPDAQRSPEPDGDSEAAAPLDSSSDPPDAPSAESPADAVADPLRAMTEERDQWKDRHLRLAADFDNYRKRSENRMRSGWDRAQADLAERLLDPLDDLERLAGWEGEVPSTAESVVEGAGLVGRKFRRILEDAGLSVVDPAGERFDPNTMEAMMRAPAESDEDDEKVERVFQKGYAFKGQLLRPARVSVYKAE